MGGGMARVRNMQGVPAHLEYLHSEDSEGRHTCKSCVYYHDFTCNSPKSSYFKLKHSTARYCMVYKRK